VGVVAEFPDTLAWLVDYLTPRLQANGYPYVTVGDLYKGDSLEVWLQRDGGRVLDVARAAASIRVNCFHDDPAKVDALAQRVSTLMRLAPMENDIVLTVQQNAGPLLINGIKPQRYMLFDVTVAGVSVSLA
jgi:hypothetical protein